MGTDSSIHLHRRLALGETLASGVPWMIRKQQQPEPQKGDCARGATACSCEGDEQAHQRDKEVS